MAAKRGFASDNNAGVHPKILEAIQQANVGHEIAYGDDPYTRRAVQLFREYFGDDIDVYFVFNGTAANVLSIKALTRSYHSVICSEQAHLHEDECGAPENFTGCKLLTVPTSDGKLTIEGIRKHMRGFGFEHHAQPRVISLTQATEMGTVYTPEEIRQISDYAHENGLFVHMDGARLANAAASLNVSLREITADVGVDVLSFGGTKDGMLMGESVVFFHKNLSIDFKYIRKQGMQLGSKMRFLSAQFIAWLSDDLWLENARHANRMARYLAEKVKRIPQITITQPVQANGVFAIVPAPCIPILQKEFFFYVWNEATSEVRWMTSFDTTEDDINRFVELIRKTLREMGEKI
ncbi:MAG: low specificity L-threonine aldolase [Calditrichia bacterium]